MSLCIIDGYNFVFRAFYSLPPLLTSKKVPIGAVYGFINMLTKLVEEHECAMLVIALDSGKKTFRSHLYPQYKQNREEPHESLKAQFPIIREAIKAFGIKGVEVIGFEADDIIATYTKLALKENLKVKIISSDKDLVQLMQDNVTIYDPLKKIYITPNIISEKYDIQPSQMIDYLSLVGDTADNIPGVKGIGKKTAATLLNQFRTLEDVYNNIHIIQPPRVQTLLRNSKSMAFLSKRLVVLDNKVNLPLDITQLKFNNITQENLNHFLEKYDIQSLNIQKGKYLKRQLSSTLDLVETKVITSEQLCQLYLEIEEFGKFYFHHEHDIFSCYFGNYLYKISLHNTEYYNTFDNILEKLKNIFEKESIKKICFNVSATIRLCNNKNIDFKIFDDISLLAYILHTGKQKISLENINKLYDFNNHNDALSICRLYKILKRKVVDEKKLGMYENLEKPLLLLLMKTENTGIKVDKEILNNLGIEFQKKLNTLEDEIFKLSHVEFNIASPKQLGVILFEKLKLKGGKKSKKSEGYVTDAEALEKYRIPIVTKVLEWRHYSKLISTYINALKNAIDQDDHRIHTNFSTINTSTGRLSSCNPNLQNIPIKTKDGNRIREAFIAKENHSIVSADYCQIELRILAEIANIESLKNAFLVKKDVHAITASQIFKIPLKQINLEHRRKAKAINFGIIYGQSAYSLANILNITTKEASEYIQSYFCQYPGIQQYINNTIQFATKNGYVETLMGRKCYVENINSKNYNLRSIAQRASINAPIQGTASEIIKKAMISLDTSIQKFLILQIHDELLFEVPDIIIKDCCLNIKNVMESTFKLSTPIDVNISYGKSWCHTTKFIA